MVEMELKVRIPNKEQIVQRLHNAGCVWTEAMEQADTIYLNREKESVEYVPVFRIRKMDNRIILTMKVQAKDLNTAKELELEISDEETMHQILHTIGYEAVVKVNKKRSETKYMGYTICMDEVEQLGVFVEIEKLTETAEGIEEEYKVMMQVLESLGITREQLVKEKYFEMMKQNKNNI